MNINSISYSNLASRPRLAVSDPQTPASGGLSPLPKAVGSESGAQFQGQHWGSEERPSPA